MPPLVRPRNRILPDEVLHTVARETMREHFQVLRSRGKTNARVPEEFYGFRPRMSRKSIFISRASGAASGTA